jgi:TATA-box binding protein (TBP) (component of TFIID and TFIIIB)
VGAMSTKEFAERARATVEACRRSHAAHVKAQPQEDLSDERVLSYCRYTDGLPLKDYENTLELVPGLVNLVSLAEAVPIDGSSLPFNLKAIAVKCRNAVYFAPRRFTAIQLAFDSPRSRVLLFRMHRLPLTLQARLSVQSQDTNRRFLRVCVPTDTGRMVGTGCDGPFAAKLAVIRAVKTISEEAGVHIGIRKFAVRSTHTLNMSACSSLSLCSCFRQVINQVGAVALNAKIDCDKFADVHSADSHYDKKSFVGLAVCRAHERCRRFAILHAHTHSCLRSQWRPAGESICAECYSTGKTNLPGSRRERHMLRSFARMAPEMYRCSSKLDMVDRFAEHLRHVHTAENSAGAGEACGPHKSRAGTPDARSKKRSLSSNLETDMFLWGGDDEMAYGAHTTGSTQGQGRQRGASEVSESLLIGLTGMAAADIDNEDLNEIFGE